jgi:CelD/BcsL family acetyltransferase involved in cellulose biosynthesis
MSNRHFPEAIGGLMRLSGTLTTKVIHHMPHLRNLVREWTELWQKCSNPSPFQRPEWLVPWAETFTPEKLHVVELRRGDELAGIAPMFAYDRHGETILAPLGAGITDYLDWLVSPDLASEGIVEILTALLDSDRSWNRIDLPDVPAWSTLLNYSEPGIFRWVSQELCPALQLPNQYAENRTAIPERQRKNLRTARNRIRRAGIFHVEIANCNTLPEFLDALFDLHTTRWQAFGMPGVLSESAIRSFHQRSAPELLQSGILRFYGLRFRGELIAVLHTVCGPDSICCYLQGFNPEFAFFSPGMQIIAAVVEDAAREGKKVVDFLRGSEPYKYAWGARDRKTSYLQVTRKELADQLSLRHAA